MFGYVFCKKLITLEDFDNLHDAITQTFLISRATINCCLKSLMKTLKRFDSFINNKFHVYMFAFNKEFIYIYIIITESDRTYCLYIYIYIYISNMLDRFRWLFSIRYGSWILCFNKSSKHLTNICLLFILNNINEIIYNNLHSIILMHHGYILLVVYFFFM